MPYTLSQRQQREWKKYLMTLWQRREPETKRLRSAAKRKLPELKALLKKKSCCGDYDRLFYDFYHHSLGLVALKPSTVEIVEELQALAPHLRLNQDFLQIVAEGTGNGFGIFHNVSSPKDDHAIVEAFFHARHMLANVCQFAAEVPEPPPTLPSMPEWATVLYLYNLW